MFAVAVGEDLGVLSAEISSIEGRNLTLNALEDFAQGFPPIFFIYLILYRIEIDLR